TPKLSDECMSTFDFDFGESRGGTANGRRQAPSPATRKRAAALPGAFRKMEICEFAIVVDSREQLPYRFDGLTNPKNGKAIIVPTLIAGLPTGDYSIAGLESEICCERKELSDAFGTFGQGRNRFTRELE